ncbi:FKBP-type peptidyl-prolyl cis-trans isomerase [Streptomyces sp. V4I8]
MASDTSNTRKSRKSRKTKSTNAAKATKQSSDDGRGKKLTQGDQVTWHSHGSTTEGTVERKITRRTKAAGRTVDASPEEPQYEVRSAKSGRSAVHKPSALRKK